MKSEPEKRIGEASQAGNTAPKRYNYISIKIQEWISRSAPCFLPFLRGERRKDNEEIKNHSERRNATYVEISCQIKRNCRRRRRRRRHV